MGHSQEVAMTVTEVKGVTKTRDTAMTGTSKLCQGNKGQGHDWHQSNVSQKQGRRPDGSHDCETDLVWRVLAEAWLGRGRSCSGVLARQ